MTKKIKCPNCGYEYDEGTQFCPNCDLISEDSQNIHSTPQNEESLKNRQLKLAHDEEVRQRLREKYEHNQEQTVSELENSEEPIEMTDPVEFVEPIVSDVAENDLSKENSFGTNENEVVGNQEKMTDSVESNRKKKKRTKNPESMVATTSVVKETPPTDSSWKRPSEQKQTSENENVTQQKPKKNNYKSLVLVAVLLFALGVGGWGYTQYQASKEEEKLTQVDKEYQSAKLEFEKLYFDEQKVFLSAGTTQAKISDAQKTASAIENKKYVEDLATMSDDVQERFSKQEALNELFEDPILVGNVLSDQAALKANVETIALAEVAGSDEFDTKINEGLVQAQEQLTVHNEAKTQMAKVMSEDKVVGTLKDADYEAAKKVVGSIKNEELKESYEKQLQTADKFLADKKATEEKEAKEAEEKQVAAANASATNAAANQGNQATGEQIFSSEQVDRWYAKNPTVQDGALSGLDPGQVSDDPWTWAPGVQSTVLNECFRRGYILDGGYTLVQSKVVDGQGYYDLYATNANAPFLSKWSNVETPFYLVTINCKTGWFKGNGSDGTVT